MAIFNVACNWEDDLLDGLSDFPEVKWIFGKRSKDAIGGGRPAYAVPSVTKVKAIDYIRRAKHRGLKFNYLFNSACLGNREFTQKGHRAIIQELDWAVYKAKVNGITVSTSYLLTLARKRYPRLTINVGAFAKVCDIDQCRFYEDLGADSITLKGHFVGQYSFLEKLKKSVKCDVQLIINEMERYWCLQFPAHLNSVAHSSQYYSKSQSLWGDPCLWSCAQARLKNSDQWLVPMIIRPEDLEFYEQMGYHHNKIVGRSRSSEWILRAVKAYSDRCYSGNLLDICGLGFTLGKMGISNNVVSKFGEYFRKYYSSDKKWLKVYFGEYNSVFPYMDNTLLGGLCRSSDPRLLMRKAIKFRNSLKRKELVKILQESLDQFCTNRLCQ